jgi:uroporphyrinogen decarboxylase
MYKELLQPAHKKTIDFAKSHGKKVIMHACGYVAPLVPHLIESGIDCLQVIEVKAGMDLLQLYRDFGDRLSFMGGIDVRKIYTNDKAIIDFELESKIPIVKQGFGYVVHSDHSIPATVDYNIYRYFIEKALALGRY